MAAELTQVKATCDASVLEASQDYKKLETHVSDTAGKMQKVFVDRFKHDFGEAGQSVTKAMEADNSGDVAAVTKAIGESRSLLISCSNWLENVSPQSFTVSEEGAHTAECDNQSRILLLDTLSDGLPRVDSLKVVTRPSEKDVTHAAGFVNWIASRKYTDRESSTTNLTSP